MHVRVRDINPRLSHLVRATWAYREHTATVQVAAHQANPQAGFQVGDTRYTRLTAATAGTATALKQLIVTDDAGRHFDSSPRR